MGASPEIAGTEDDPLPISTLQHFLFCPRQCAPIHIERLWAENALTAEMPQLLARHLRGDLDLYPPFVWK